MKNRTVAVILAISGLLLGIAVYRTIAANISQQEEITPFQSTGINDPFVQGPQSSPEYDEANDDDFFGEDD